MLSPNLYYLNPMPRLSNYSHSLVYTYGWHRDCETYITVFSPINSPWYFMFSSIIILQHFITSSINAGSFVSCMLCVFWFVIRHLRFFCGLFNSKISHVQFIKFIFCFLLIDPETSHNLLKQLKHSSNFHF